MTWTPAMESELRYLLRLSYRARASERIASGCSGKAKYPHQAAAMRAMPRRDAALSAHPYRCKHCGAWHIGTRKPGDKRGMKVIGEGG